MQHVLLLHHLVYAGITKHMPEMKYDPKDLVEPGKFPQAHTHISGSWEEHTHTQPTGLHIDYYCPTFRPAKDRLTEAGLTSC